MYLFNIPFVLHTRWLQFPIVRSIFRSILCSQRFKEPGKFGASRELELDSN